ncbi:MAG: hypothetical protein JXR64_01940 [Spirochaetales bacterium]|nr:hypothetical protein [Spirochaetales bacterium]
MKYINSLSISLAFHVIILMVALVFLPQKKILEEENDPISVEIILKNNNEIVPNSRDVIAQNVDIIESKNKKTPESSDPEVDNLIKTNQVADLVLRKKEYDSDISIKKMDISSFEDSLTEMITFEELLEENESRPSIKWDSNNRTLQNNSSIDFSSFPEKSFTGVGVTVYFTVDKSGGVYDIEIKPPGSGSVEFDILVKQYVAKFHFSESESSSRGELTIVYKK